LAHTPSCKEEERERERGKERGRGRPSCSAAQKGGKRKETNVRKRI
jgi:hypothetical protein